MTLQPTTSILPGNFDKATLVYPPPKYRGDSDRCRELGQNIWQLQPGQRIGHLVIVGLGNARFIKYHGWPCKCVWEICKIHGRRSMVTVYSDTEPNECCCSEPMHRMAWWNVLCDCGNVAIIEESKLIHGQQLSCGECSALHAMNKEEELAGVRAIRSDCGKWCCTSARYYAGLSPYPVSMAA